MPITHRPGGWLEQAMKWAAEIQKRNAERERLAMAREDKKEWREENPKTKENGSQTGLCPSSERSATDERKVLQHEGFPLPS